MSDTGMGGKGMSVRHAENCSMSKMKMKSKMTGASPINKGKGRA